MARFRRGYVRDGLYTEATQVVRRTSRSRYALAAAVALLAAACGSSGRTEESGSTATDTGSTATSPSTADVSTTEVAPTTTAGSTTSAKSTTPTSEAAGCSTLLQSGCRSNDVRRLQRLLNSKGFGPVTVDQTFGAETVVALDSFERACRTVCTRDGRILIDRDEWAYLESLPTTAPEEPSG